MKPLLSFPDLYSLSVLHMTRLLDGSIIYGLLIDSRHYYLSKAQNKGSCFQLDSGPVLQSPLLKEVCELLTSFEFIDQEDPVLELVNAQIVKLLHQKRPTCN